MKKNFHLIVLFLFCLTFAYSQSFEDFVSKGDSLYREKNYLESVKNFDFAFEIRHGNKIEYYNAACSSALDGDTVKSLEYLCRAVERGWINLDHILNDKDLKVLHDSDEWNTIILWIKENVEKQGKDYDDFLINKLEEINTKDQTLRWLLGEAEQKFGRNSDKMKFYWELIAEQDSTNIIEVVKIIEEKGWLGTDLIGEKGNKTLWLVIQHAPLQIQEKYLPLLEKSVIEGKSDGSHLALLIDRVLMKKGEPQLYGSQVTVDKETEKKIPYKIKEPQYVNKRRREIGLGPIEEYLANWDIKWTIEQIN